LAVPSRASVKLSRTLTGGNGSPSSLVDSSANAYTLTKNGTLADRSSSKAKFTPGYDFDGNSANYLSQSNAAFRVTGDLVVFTALEIDDLANNYCVLAMSTTLDGTSATNQLYNILVTTDGRVQVEWMSSTNVVTKLRTLPGAITTGFHTLLLVRAANNQMNSSTSPWPTALNLYIDGVWSTWDVLDGVDVTNSTGWHSPSGGGNTTFRIGRCETSSLGAGPFTFNGGIHETRIWAPADAATMSQPDLLALADATQGAFVGTPMGDELACWFFGTFPSQSLVLEESLDTPGGGLIALSVDMPQSVGQQSANVSLRNRGGKFNDWASGQVVRFEAKKATDSAYGLLLEGIVDQPVFPGGLQPTMSCKTTGLLGLLDVAQLSADVKFQDTAYTTIFTTLAKRFFPGYTLSVTTDASFPGNVTFQSGMKVRDALDWCRRGLTYATGNRWEMDVTRDGSTGAKTLSLYVRATTVTRTLGVKDCIGVPVRYAGAMSDIVNRVQVYGATGPASMLDYTKPRVTASTSYVPNNETVASAFVAQAGGLTGWAPYLDRFTYANPQPTITGYLARNSDNQNVISRGIQSRATILRNPIALGANFTTAADNVFHEVIVYDFGTTRYGVNGPCIQTILFAIASTLTGGTDVWEFSYSNDDITYTVATTFTNPAGATTQFGTLASNPDAQGRYWRLRYKNTAAETANVSYLELQRFKNLQTSGVTNPQAFLDNGVGTNTTMLTAPGSGQTTIALLQNLPGTDAFLPRVLRLAKLQIQHSEANGTVDTFYRFISYSTGIVIATLPASTTLVTDTIFFTPTMNLQYLQLCPVDNRASGSNVTWTIQDLLAFEETPYDASQVNQPLLGDQFGGTTTWGSSNLTPPAALNPFAQNASDGYEALGTIGGGTTLTVAGSTYWYCLDVPQVVGRNNQAYTLLTTTKDATLQSLKRTIGGASWASIGGPTRRVMAQLQFGSGRLQTTLDDVGSQAAFANILPHGRLVGSISDAVLQTADMVNSVGNALLSLRKVARDRIEVSIPGDSTKDVGNRVTLDQELAFTLGLTGPVTYDCVREEHTFQAGGWIKKLTLNDQPPAQYGLRLVAGIATGRTV